MTPEEKSALKGKIQKVMVDHLTTLGYPDITREQILAELKPMWIKLEEAGLIQPGMSFVAYADAAQVHCMMADMSDVFF